MVLGLDGSTRTKVNLALLAFLAYFIAACWAKMSYAPNTNFTVGPKVAGAKVPLLKPIARKGSGNLFVVERPNLFPDLADTADEPFRSPIELYENENRLGPPHATLGQISKLGGGRFLHVKEYGATIYFSTSDNSDPNTNGKAYWVVNPAIR